MSTFLVYSLRRSGHHAIIFWIVKNLGGFTHKDGDHHFFNSENDLHFYNDCSNTQIEHYFPSRFSRLIKNYEDEELPDIDSLRYLPHDVTYIIILRDFLNYLASIQSHAVLSQMNSKSDCLSKWKKYAKFILQCQRDNTGKYVCIIYNKWLTDKNYRDEISHSLSISNDRDDIQSYVDLGFGGGSSFIGKKIETDKSYYLNRYKQLNLTDQEKSNFKNDKELCELSRKLFNIDIKYQLS